MSIHDETNDNVDSNLINKLGDLIGKQRNAEQVKEKYCKFMSQIDNVLDASSVRQNDAKQEIKRIIAQWINGESSDTVWALKDHLSGKTFYQIWNRKLFKR